MWSLVTPAVETLVRMSPPSTSWLLTGFQGSFHSLVLYIHSTKGTNCRPEPEISSAVREPSYRPSIKLICGVYSVKTADNPSAFLPRPRFWLRVYQHIQAKHVEQWHRVLRKWLVSRRKLSYFSAFWDWWCLILDALLGLGLQRQYVHQQLSDTLYCCRIWLASEFSCCWQLGISLLPFHMAVYFLVHMWRAMAGRSKWRRMPGKVRSYRLVFWMSWSGSTEAGMRLLPGLVCIWSGFCCQSIQPATTIVSTLHMRYV